MGSCSWPRGCIQEALNDDARCYYHAKVVQGLIQPDWYLFEPKTTKPPKLRRRRLAQLLSREGASPLVVTQAETVRMHPSAQARYGTGFIRTGTLR